MRKLAAIAGIAAAGLGIQATAYGYSTTANVTFSWATGGTDIGWTSNGANTISSMTNATYFTSIGGNNSVGFYNSDFASAAGCAAAVEAVDPGGTLTSTRKYGCRYNDALSGTPLFVSEPVGNISQNAPDTGPNGAAASGSISVTDTTMTGTLTIIPTTDEPTGGTAANVGLGASGYNLRQADGSPFGNSWAGVSTAGTYTLNLTGVFTATSWQITGGTARFTDTGFLCQQGGNSSPANILCSASTQAGGYQSTGTALSWGWDLDGSGASTAMSQIEVRDASDAFLVSLSGVLANLSVDGAGNISTNQGEIRRGLGSASCTPGTIKYDASITKLSCGTLTVANLNVAGQTVVPAPAAVWLLGTGIAALAARRRFAKKAA